MRNIGRFAGHHTASERLTTTESIMFAAQVYAFAGKQKQSRTQSETRPYLRGRCKVASVNTLAVS